MKRMKHPDHGFHHAYSPQEEETMRKNGWVDDEAEAPKQEAPEPTRRGRPPKPNDAEPVESEA